MPATGTWVGAIALAALALSTVRVNAEEKKAAGEEIAARILELENLWASAVLRKDVKTLEAVLAPEFTLTTAGGETSRENWFKSLLSWDHKAADVKECRVAVYGDAALARVRLHWHVVKNTPDPRTGSRELDSDFVISDLWIKRGGRWQVVSRFSVIPAQPPPSTRRPAKP